MVRGTSGHREDSLSRDGNGRAPRKEDPRDDPRDAVMKAAERGRLDDAQAKALLDLTSRMGVLGFENGRVVAAFVIDIASEVSPGHRTKLVHRLRDFLENDGLAKDLAPEIIGAFGLD